MSRITSPTRRKGGIIILADVWCMAAFTTLRRAPLAISAAKRCMGVEGEEEFPIY